MLRGIFCAERAGLGLKLTSAPCCSSPVRQRDKHLLRALPDIRNSHGNAKLACGSCLCLAVSLLQPDSAVAVLHVEPDNALSLPTWAVHTASVAEWLVAMDLVWTFGERTGRNAWKGLAWGMLPLHASSLCAVTYHLFYNPPQLCVPDGSLRASLVSHACPLQG
jgi:hypothetical protein